jgi:hypothetical protein
VCEISTRFSGCRWPKIAKACASMPSVHRLKREDKIIARKHFTCANLSPLAA